MNEKDRLEVLKEILFTDDREYAEKIAERLKQLEQTVNDEERLAHSIKPIVGQELKDFSKKLPPLITSSLKAEIKNSQDDVVDALFPIIGKMIKKYVAQEMSMLTEKINKQLAFMSPFGKIKRKFRSWFGGVKEEEMILSSISTAKIEQVLVIEKDSGILVASFSDTKTIDEEMVAGMLTAIKTFVEDAFVKKNQNLELIEYELYHIQLQSFVGHYVAVVISGNYTLDSKNKIQDIIFDFYYDFMAMKMSDDIDEEQLRENLYLSFDGAEI